MRSAAEDVMHRQLRALLDAAERPTVTIQVLPFSAGAHPALVSSFQILDFAARLRVTRSSTATA